MSAFVYYFIGIYILIIINCISLVYVSYRIKVI